MIIFLKALNEGRIISGNTLKLMHNWHKLQFRFNMEYETMYFKLPRFISMVMKMPPSWGHSVSTGSFLYSSHDPEFLYGRIYQSSRIKVQTVKTDAKGDEGYSIKIVGSTIQNRKPKPIYY